MLISIFWDKYSIVSRCNLIKKVTFQSSSLLLHLILNILVISHYLTAVTHFARIHDYLSGCTECRGVQHQFRICQILAETPAPISVKETFPASVLLWPQQSAKERSLPRRRLLVVRLLQLQICPSASLSFTTTITLYALWVTARRTKLKHRYWGPCICTFRVTVLPLVLCPARPAVFHR